MGGQTDKLNYLPSEEEEEEDENQNPKAVHNRSTNNINSKSSDSLSSNSTEKFSPKEPSIMDNHKWELNWIMVFLIIFIHIEATIGLLLGVTHAQLPTLVWFFILIQFGATGIICGAHRLWTHRAYKASLPFRLFLMFCNTLALQESIYTWCGWHRVHHKWSDTDADPHNAKRGFFFAQIGWVMVKRHPEFVAKSKVIDMTDLDQDGVVQFQHRFYVPLTFFVWFIMPTFVPWYFWSENLVVSLSFNFFRYVLSLHQTSLVNSAAHLWGEKVYDKRIMSTKHYFTTCVTMGEAYHNYHHAFPWDYSASEFGPLLNYNPMTAVIDVATALGLAWDRKKPSAKLVEERIRKYGDLERIEPGRRVPGNVLLDTLQGAFILFWALWIILALKGVYLASGVSLELPIIGQLVDFFTKYDSAKLITEKVTETWGTFIAISDSGLDILKRFNPNLNRNPLT